jgi:hypothetical protein
MKTILCLSLKHQMPRAAEWNSTRPVSGYSFIDSGGFGK